MGDTLVSVVIPTWSRSALLDRVLRALATQSIDRGTYELLVCDSHSPDETAGMVAKVSEEHAGLTVKHLHTVNNLAAKRNLGLSCATGTIVVLLDDDCIPGERHLEEFVADLERAGARSVVCGEVRYPAEWAQRSNYFRYRDSRHFGSGRRTDLLDRDLDERTLVAMNMAFRKDEVLQSAGRFDERFVGYGCEDHEFASRLVKKGFAIKQGRSMVLHCETSGSLVGYEKKLFHTARDGMGVVAQHFPDLLDKLSPPSIERSLEGNSISGTVRRLMWSGIFFRPVVSLVRWYLNRTDRVALAYSGALFRYVLGASYWRGANARAKRITEQASQRSWYD